MTDFRGRGYNDSIASLTSEHRDFGDPGLPTPGAVGADFFNRTKRDESDLIWELVNQGIQAFRKTLTADLLAEYIHFPERHFQNAP